MSDSMKLGIEMVLKGGAQVTAGIRGVGQTMSTLGREFRDGLITGMQQAVRDADRPLADLKAMADDARKALNIRSDIEIQGDIDKARKAYDDLKSSGLATAGELNRAKDAMKTKIGELRQEMGKWSGDWSELGRKATEAGQKMQAIGAKMAIAGAPAILAGKNAISAEYSLAGVANTAGLDPAKADATIAQWKTKINELARYTNQTQGDLIEGLNTFVSKGMDPEKALELLRSVGKAATATGSQVTDIAESMFQAGEALKIPVSEAAKSLDMMAAAGAAGSFELKNMAKDLPNLSAKYASLGGTGQAALGTLTAAAQIAMKTTSDTGVAANNLANFLDKLASPETIKNFDKMGVNLTALVKKGIDSGDLVGYMGEQIGKLTGGKAEKLGELFTDVQARSFALAITQNLGEYQKIRGEVVAAVGTIDQQATLIGKTTQEKMKGIGISMNAAFDEATLFQKTLEGIKSVAEWFAANPDVFGPVATILTALAAGGTAIAAVGVAIPAIITGLTAIAAAGPALVAAAPAIAAIVGAIAAFKVGFAFGTWINEQIDAAVQGLTGKKNLGVLIYDMVQAIKELPAKAKAALAAFPGEMKYIGEQIINGLVNGIKAKAGAVIDSIKNLGGEAVKSLKALLDMHSPSKVFMVIGEQIGEGMAIGMMSKVKNVHDAATKLGTTAAYGTKDAMSAKWLQGQLKDYDALQDDMKADAKKAAVEAERAAERVARDGVRLTESLRTDMEKATENLAEYDDLLAAGAITWDTYARAVFGAVDAIDKVGEKQLGKKDQRNKEIGEKYAAGASTASLSKEYGLSEEWIKKLVAQTKDADTVFVKLRSTVESAFQGMEDALVNFVMTGKMDFKSLANSIISDLVRIQIQETMTSALKPLMNSAVKAIGSIFGFSQGGTPGGVSAWRNQVVDKPTFFAFANGGVMGEAGPEAIMPLKRGPDGSLGVSGGGSNVTVNVINNAKGTKATARERNDGQGNRMIDVFIEQIEQRLAGGVARGSGPLTSALQSTYGLNRAAGAY